MKALVKPFLSEGEFVSSNDMLLSFVWMLSCEFIAEKHPILTAADLGLNNTALYFTYELVKNGYTVVPENYFGNAFFPAAVQTKGEDLEGLSLVEVFARMALMTRKVVSDARKLPPIAAQTILMYYQTLNGAEGMSANVQSGFRAAVSTIVKTPVGEIDFGQGPPAWYHFQGWPSCPFLYGCMPGPCLDGILIAVPVLAKWEETFRNSVVRKSIAPDAKDVYAEYSVEELEKKLKKTAK